MGTYFGETDIFSTIGEAYGEEYGPIGAAIGEAGGRALDKAVDAALGYLEAGGRRLLGYGRKSYPKDDLIKAGYEEYAHYILHGYYKPSKFPKLREGERGHYTSGRLQLANEHHFEATIMNAGWAFDLLEGVAPAARAAIEASLEASKKRSGYDGVAALEGQAAEAKAANKKIRERNKVRYLVNIGKNPKLGPTRSAGWAQQNLVNGVVGGFLPAEMLVNLPTDVAQQARRALAGIESGAAAVGETVASAYGDEAERAREAADRAAAQARQKIADTLAEYGR